MAASNIVGLVLILFVSDTAAQIICYYYDNMYLYMQYVGYCYEGCCGSQCCESTSTTEAPKLDESTVAAIVVGCVLGLALFVAIVIIIAVCCYYKQKNQIHSGRVLTTQPTYPLMFQGTISHTPPSHLPPLSDNRLRGASMRPSHGHFQSGFGIQQIEMVQFPQGQRNDPPGYLPDTREMTQPNHGRPNDPPDYEPTAGTSNGNPPLATLPDLKY